MSGDELVVDKLMDAPSVTGDEPHPPSNVAHPSVLKSKTSFMIL